MKFCQFSISFHKSATYCCPPFIQPSPQLNNTSYHLINSPSSLKPNNHKIHKFPPPKQFNTSNPIPKSSFRVFYLYQLYSTQKIVPRMSNLSYRRSNFQSCHVHSQFNNKSTTLFLWEWSRCCCFASCLICSAYSTFLQLLLGANKLA